MSTVSDFRMQVTILRASVWDVRTAELRHLPGSSSTVRHHILSLRAEEPNPRGNSVRFAAPRVQGAAAASPSFGVSRATTRTPRMRLFVTGAAGFIGSNYVHHVLGTSDDHVTVFDALTYAGNLENLAGLDDDPRFTFVKGNITDRDAVDRGHGRTRRGRPLRGREPRRPLDRQPRRVRAHELRRHAT